VKNVDFLNSSIANSKKVFVLYVLGIFCYSIFSCVPLGSSWRRPTPWGTRNTGWKPL